MTSTINPNQPIPAASALEWIAREGILVILRGDFSADTMLEIGDALLASPLLALEVTMNTPGALSLIELLRERFGEHMLIGAGTVRTATQLREAWAAGAQFSVAPDCNRNVVEAAQTADRLHIPGVLTPNEVATAHAMGCDLLKLFPADLAGGPGYLKALAGPYDDIHFMPTGGVTAENAPAYARAGAFALGVGSAVVTGPAQPMSDLITRARALRAAWGVAGNKS